MTRSQKPALKLTLLAATALMSVTAFKAQASPIQKIQPNEREWGVKVAKHAVLRAVTLDPRREVLQESSIQFPNRSKKAVDVVRNTVFNTKEGSACMMDVKQYKKSWRVVAKCYDRKNKLRVININLAKAEVMALR